VLESELPADAGEAVGFIARPVVGKHLADSDAEPFVPGYSRGQEVGRTALGLVRIHGGEGDARVVIDSHMKELGTDALDTISAVTGDPVRRPLDPHQTLDVEVQHVTRSRVFVAVGRQLRFDIADAVELQPAQHTADRRMAQPELVRDPDAGPSLSPEPFDLNDPLPGRSAWRTMRTRTTVLQPRYTLLPITPDPLGRTLPAEPVLDCKSSVEHDGGSPFDLLGRCCFATSASQFSIEWTTTY